MSLTPPGPTHCRLSDLSFASNLVVWALRQGVHDPGNALNLKQTFERTFGTDGVNAAMAAFGRLVGSLRRGLKQMPDIRLPEDGEVSRQEAALLTIVASIQLGLGEEAQKLIARMIFKDEREEFTSVATVFSKNLAAVGHVLPPDGTGHGPDVPLSRWSRSRPKPHHRRTKGLAGLTAQESTIVVGLRLWVTALKKNDSAHAALHAHFHEWGVVQATNSLNAVLNHTARCATRVFDIRCPKCPGLSADEARILNAVAAMQRGNRIEAIETLMSWLPPQVAQITIVPVEGLARVFQEAGAELPPRHWRFEAMEHADRVHTSRRDDERPEDNRRPTLH
ncbi:MAG: hypothetical protein AAF414_09475 [Pseudomonadota bacterium]